jgi:hypothetical protein
VASNNSAVTRPPPILRNAWTMSPYLFFLCS